MPVGLARTIIEIKLFFRDREALIFIFFFPVMLLAIFTTAFSGGTIGGSVGHVTVAQYYAPAMMASGIFLSSFQTLAINIALERDDGTLKRLARDADAADGVLPRQDRAGRRHERAADRHPARPVRAAPRRRPPGQRRGLAAIPVDLPARLGGGTVLGIAFSVFPKSARSAAAIVTPIVLILQFISGVFFVFYDLPSWMQQIGAMFPLKWLAQGMRSVFFPEEMAALEAAGSWELGTTAIVLAIWLVIGLVACRLVFRWTPRGSG